MIPNKAEYSIPVIYQITNVINGKIYVGSAKNFYERYREYEKFDRFKAPGRSVEHAIRKWGFSYFVFSILEIVVDEQRLLEREQFYLNQLVPFVKTGNGYNICVTAGSRLGMKHTEITRKKLSQANIGKRHTVETCELIRLASTGRRHSDIARQKMSIIAKSRPETYKTRNNRLVLRIDKHDSRLIKEYTSLKEAAEQNQIGSSAISLVCTRRMTSAGGYYWCYKDKYDPLTFRPRVVKKGFHGICIRPILQLDKTNNVINTWSSATEAGRVLNVDKTCIAKCCSGIRPTAYGYKWAFVTDENVIQEIRSRLKREWEDNHVIS